MEWLQILSLFLANAGLIIWFRTESRNDWRYCDAQIKAIHNEIHAEMKDFHTRLALQDQDFKMRMCAIEEKYREKRWVKEKESVMYE